MCDISGLLISRVAIGCTGMMAFLSWWDMTLGLTRWSRILKGLLLPLWLPACAITNLVGWCLDRVDHTGSFYHKVMLVARRR